MPKSTTNWNKLFYFNSALPSAAYSDTPNYDLNPTRLLDSLPAFKSGEGMPQYKKRVIALPAIDFSRQKKDTRSYFEHLKSLGFRVVFSNGYQTLNYLYCYFDTDTKQFYTAITQFDTATKQKLSLSDYSQQLKIPADEIYLFTEQSLKQCVEDSEWEWEYYDSFETIILNYLPITNHSLGELFKRHGDEIVTLELSNCYNLESSLPFTHLSLKNLKRIEIHFCTFPINVLGHLIGQTPELEELTIVGGISNTSFSFSPICPNLKKIYLSYCRIHELHTILEQAHSLTELTLINVVIISELGLGEARFSKLKILVLNNTYISRANLKHILEQLTELEKLYLNGYNIPDLPIPIPSQLKKLSIVQSHIDVDKLSRILEQMTGLVELDLRYLTFTGTLNLQQTKFNKLKKIIITETYITEYDLQHLFEQAVELEELYMSRIEIENIELEKAHFAKLENVMLRDCSISANGFLNLVEAAANPINVKIIGTPVLNPTQMKILKRPGVYLNYIPRPNLLIQPPIEQPKELLSLYNNTHTIDANTHFDKNKRFDIEQQFLGKTHQPHPSELRLNAYPDVTLNPKSQGIGHPFILNKPTLPLKADLTLNQKASPSPLYPQFCSDQSSDYFGRFKLRLSKNWLPLPSISAQETLQAYYLDQNLPIEFVKSMDDGFYYVRLSNQAPEQSREVILEIALHVEEQANPLDHLPHQIKEIIRDCRGYRDTDLTITSANTSAQEYLDAIIKERTGACRHRSIAFKALMSKQFPGIKVQIIENECHMFAEVLYQGLWISCDLGGHDAKVVIKQGLIPEAGNHQETQQYVHPERVYQQTVANRGTIPPEGYWKKLTNLTTFTLDQTNSFPSELDTSRLDTLIIKDAAVTAWELLDLLDQTPQLKTLKLLHIRITKDEFELLNFSMLKHIEYIQLTGSFIPNSSELTRLKQTTDAAVRWAVESANVYEEKQQANDIEVEELEPVDHKEPVKEPEPKPEAEPKTETEAAKPETLLKPSKAKRVIPNHRYFQAPVNHSAFAYIKHPKKSTLLKTSNPQQLGYVLQHYCKTRGYAYFYIAQPWELACSKPIIANQKNIGVIKPGPAGAFYDFIQAHKHNRHKTFIIVNYAPFEAAYIARFNSLLDDDPSVDGVAIARVFKIIGLIDPNSPECYQGSDFYSRFSHRATVDTLPEISLPTLLTTVCAEKDQTHRIELCGGGDWEARLLGHWRIKGAQLKFNPGKLTKALSKGYTKIIFNNPPVNDPEFNHFLQESAIHQALFHHGRVVKALPADLQIHMTHEVSFPDVKARIHTSNDHPDNKYLVLNPASLSQFLGIYTYDKPTKGLKLATGWIKQNRDHSLAVYLTHSLSEHQWLRLFEAARLYNTRFDLRLAPGVRLPDSLKLVNKPKVYAVQQLPSHTASLVSPNGELDSYPSDAIVIDVSELTAADLFYSLRGHFDETHLKFNFSQKPGYVLTQLAKKKTLILIGKWPEELAQHLQSVLYERSTNAKAVGQLIVVSDTEKTFPGIPTTQVAIKDNSAPTHVRKQTLTFDERMPAIEAVLKEEPFVVISGDTGTGKSYFMQYIWKDKHPQLHFGEQAIKDWILDDTPGLKILFIDEANLAGREWSEFSRLKHNPPAIFYQGKYYPLTKDHKVIFAGNPQSYGGERQLPRLFQQAHCELEFKPIPHRVTLAPLNLRKSISRPILKAAKYISSLSEHELLITPRELIMMAALTQAALKADPTLEPRDLAAYFAYEIGSQHLNPEQKLEFAQKFKPKQALHFKSCDLKLETMVLTETNTPAFKALIHQLDLRSARKQAMSKRIAAGGLGGLILEGEPGLGKSEMIMDVLNAQGFIRDQDYFYIPVAMNQPTKEALLVKAFHEGKLVIIDEINSSPLLERLLNALLEGHDLDNNPAQQPGFLLLGTQNPIHFSGRRATTLPVKHRLQTVVMPEYSQGEMVKILIEKQLPPRIAQDMTAEYLANKKNNKELCFRDLIKNAKTWLTLHKQDEKITIQFSTLPQVGHECKIVSIASIDNYYAQQCGFEAVALHANNKDHPNDPRFFSIRKLAKRNGSVQGEILEYKTWVKNLNDLGYKTETIAYNNDINLFINSIVSALQQGDLPLVGFAVSEDSGHPDPKPVDPQAREHATIICGYNPKTDELTIKHWGNTYEVDAVTLFNSSRALPDTRKQEFYHLNPSYTHAKKHELSKYLPSTKENDRNSIKPSENTGFRAKLLIVKKPEKVSALIKKRQKTSNTPWVQNHLWV